MCGHPNHEHGPFHTLCAKMMAESMTNPVQSSLTYGRGQTVRFHEPFSKKEMYLQVRAKEIFQHIYLGLSSDSNLAELLNYAKTRTRGTFKDAIVEEVAKHMRWAIQIEPVEWHVGVVGWIAEALTDLINQRTLPRE